MKELKQLLLLSAILNTQEIALVLIYPNNAWPSKQFFGQLEHGQCYQDQQKLEPEMKQCKKVIRSAAAWIEHEKNTLKVSSDKTKNKECKYLAFHLKESLSNSGKNQFGYR